MNRRNFSRTRSRTSFKQKTKLKKVTKVNLVNVISNTIILSITAVITYILLRFFLYEYDHYEQKIKDTSPDVALHVNCKWAPPELSYLSRLLPALKENHINSLLLEYDNMFPYYGKVQHLRCPKHYEKSLLTQFLKTADKFKINIIPFIQTFRHLKYTMKTNKDNMEDIESNIKEYDGTVIGEILKQVVELHIKVKPLKYLAIGSDEVYQSFGKPALNTTILHTGIVYNIINSLSKEKRINVILWDDYLRGFRQDDWRKIPKCYGIQPIYWSARGNPDASHIESFKYHCGRKSIWVAKAVEGLHNYTLAIPNLGDWRENIFAETNKIIDTRLVSRNRFLLKGIILTVFNRFSDKEEEEPITDLRDATIPKLTQRFLECMKTVKLYDGYDNQEIDYTEEEAEQYKRWKNDREWQKFRKCESELSILNFFDERVHTYSDIWKPE